MKPFNQLSQEEINNLTPEEFKAIPPEEKRSCHDCNHLKAFVSLWCTNEQAKKARGTSIPGCIKCPYWEAKVSHIPKLEEILNLNRKQKEGINRKNQRYFYIIISLLMVMALILAFLPIIFKAH